MNTLDLSLLCDLKLAVTALVFVGYLVVKASRKARGRRYERLLRAELAELRAGRE